MLNTETLPMKPQVCRGEGQTGYKRARAYYLLGISPKDFQWFPYFGAQLRRIARIAHIADGNIPSIPAMALLAASEDPIAGKVRQAYSLVPESYRRLLPPEAFCHVAGASPWAVLDAVTVAAVRSGAMASAVVAAVNMPRVVQKTVEVALTDEGTRERRMFLRAAGFTDWSSAYRPG